MPQVTWRPSLEAPSEEGEAGRRAPEDERGMLMLGMWLPNATLTYDAPRSRWVLRFLLVDELRQADLYAMTEFVCRSGRRAPLVVDRRVAGAFSFRALRDMDRRMSCFSAVVFVSHDFCTRRTLEMICQLFLTTTPAGCFSTLGDAAAWLDWHALQGLAA